MTEQQNSLQQYQPIYAADFARIGYERRDKDAQPRVLSLGFRWDELQDGKHGEFHFHIAGDHSIREASIVDAVDDEELIAGMESMQALRLGIQWQRERQRLQSEECVLEGVGQ